MTKYYIYTPSYNPNVGGIVALNNLCDLMRKQGHSAYLVPFKPTFSGRFARVKQLRYVVKNILWPSPFASAADLDTPVRTGNIDDSVGESVVIYPEIVKGNPLKAKRVVRWLLHNPGFHTGEVDYAPGELYFRFATHFKEFNFDGSKTSKSILRVVRFPTNLYNKNSCAAIRTGTAYCVRKGKNKTIEHDLNDSILIDGMEHSDVSAIFKRVKRFISYDSYTGYSKLAVLCGCESIVVPDPEVSIEEWIPNVRDRYGIAYGFDNVDEANSTAQMQIERVMELESESAKNVSDAIEEIESYFNLR